jgi:hypothetical protein
LKTLELDLVPSTLHPTKINYFLVYVSMLMEWGNGVRKSEKKWSQKKILITNYTINMSILFSFSFEG